MAINRKKYLAEWFQKVKADPKWYAKRKASYKKWEKANKEKREQCYRQRVLDGRQKIADEKYKKNNYEKIKKRQRDWARQDRKNNPEKYKMLGKAKWHTRYHCEKQAGRLTSQMIEKVYRNNIFKFGVLTCVLCGLPIKNGQDSLEHLTPICRGGKNVLSNLAIAHFSCNSSKKGKTHKEYKRYQQEVAA